MFLQKKFIRIFASLQIFLIGRKKTDFCGREAEIRDDY